MASTGELESMGLVTETENRHRQSSGFHARSASATTGGRLYLVHVGDLLRDTLSRGAAQLMEDSTKARFARGARSPRRRFPSSSGRSARRTGHFRTAPRWN